jgi:hypothetical protein
MKTKIPIKLLSVFFAVAMLMLGTNVWAAKNCMAVTGASDVMFTAMLIPGTQVASGTVQLETLKSGGNSWSGDVAIILLEMAPQADGSMQLLVRLEFDFGADGSLSNVAHAILAPSGAPGEYTFFERVMAIGGTGDFAGAYGNGTAVGTASFDTGMAHVDVEGEICTP